MAINGINPVAQLFLSGTESAANASAEVKPNNSELKIEDFFALMMAQLQNQTINDTVDNTQFITQMAQFSTLSQMSDLKNSAQTNLAVSLIGKTVNATKMDEIGFEKTVSGIVEQVDFSNGDPYLLVEGEFYKISDINQIS